MSTIDINGIDKAKLLAALHNNTRALGMGFLHDKGPMSEEEAREIIASCDNGLSIMWFDYVRGRPLKVGLKEGELLRADLYDRDAPGGEGSCQRIVDSLRGCQAAGIPLFRA